MRNTMLRVRRRRRLRRRRPAARIDNTHIVCDERVCVCATAIIILYDAGSQCSIITEFVTTEDKHYARALVCSNSMRLRRRFIAPLRADGGRTPRERGQTRQHCSSTVTHTHRFRTARCAQVWLGGLGVARCCILCVIVMCMRSGTRRASARAGSRITRRRRWTRFMLHSRRLLCSE